MAVISNEKYLQLLGLYLLAKKHHKALTEIEEATAELLGVEEEEYGGYGHISDLIWGQDRTPDEVLKLLNIQVAEKKPAARKAKKK